MARLSIDIDSEAHRQIKVMAAAYNLSIKDLILGAVNQLVTSPKKMEGVPNAVTRKTLEQSKKGKNITRHKSFEDMFHHLGI